MKKTLKILIIIIFVILVVLAGAYFYIMYMPAKNVTSVKPDLVLQAAVLAHEYENEPGASDAKYIDRVIEVTGEVSEISLDQNNAWVIILRDKNTSTGILCTLNNSENKKATSVKVGNTITIKGTCTGMIFEVVLNKCVIVD